MEKSKERQREKSRRYYAANKIKINEKQKQYYQANKDVINQRRKQLRADKKKIQQNADNNFCRRKNGEEHSSQLNEDIDECASEVFYKNLCTSLNVMNDYESTYRSIVNFSQNLSQCNEDSSPSLNVTNDEGFFQYDDHGFFQYNEAGSSNQNHFQSDLLSGFDIIDDIEVELPTSFDVTDAAALINMERDACITQTSDCHQTGLSKKRKRTNTNCSQPDKRTLILEKASPCNYCGAYKFYKETERFCCSGGEVKLVQSILPDYLIKLVTSTDPEAKSFQEMIRTYNNHFAYTSIGMTCDEQLQHRDHGIYTVKVHGQVYHFLDDLIPQDTTKNLSGIQFYFYDSDHQVSNRLSALPRLDPTIVENLVEVLKPNPYSAFLKQASEIVDIDQYHIVLRSDPGLDQRRYNIPTSSEVAGIWIESEDGESDNSKKWDIRVYSRSWRSHVVEQYYGCYDPLQYVLMFPRGEPGWHPNILRSECQTKKRRRRKHVQINNEDCVTFDQMLEREQASTSRTALMDLHPNDGAGGGKHRRTTISCREYYMYKLQIRENDTSYILRFGRLFQQYIIDNYIKIETMRLDYLKHNQNKLRTEFYQGIVDSVVSGVLIGGKIGKRTYLPRSFIGGPRDMRHRYLDSMALVQEFGHPDLFLTMTCNSSWPEIKEHLKEGEEAHNRPDLLARVFKAKLGVLQEKIMNGEISGKVAYVVHVIEFQKRGLPYAHFLIILKPKYKYLTPEAYDKIVCAELPDQAEDPYLYSLVVKHMMHGPCGKLNPMNVCMKDGSCKNHYPKQFAEYTSHGEGSYPVYRRRNNNRNAKVRGKWLDNRWVVPYNPTLLLQFNCHINVEICCNIRAVKYLYKYVHKGHDKIMFRIRSDDAREDVDEISDFQKARWVSPVESAWRIFGFPLHSMSPSVIQLQVHLLNFQTLYFEDDADLQQLLKDEKYKHTMLTEFFVKNATDLEARTLNLLYKEYPKHYVWDSQERTWTKRQRGSVIGRLCVVNPVENERYYLRVLLSKVRSPTSYQYLLSVDGIMCETFQESAHRRGFLHNDNDITKSMEEAAIYRMPSELRRLFATLLHYCKPSDPKNLFETFFEQMAEDFIKVRDQLHLSDCDIQYKVLQGINDTLESLGRSVNEYHLVPFEYTATDFERYTREIAAERSIPIPDEDLHAVNQLNSQQKIAFDIIFSSAMSDRGGIFFIDGPRGTGKSFLYNVLLAHIRSRGYIGIIVASSGIASSEFLGGRTAHSRFKIPIDGEPGMKCQISVQSGEADLIRNSKIIILDEAPMAHKSAINALNELLKDLCKNSEPFGGKLIVFGGDFRQVLPVVKGGTKHDQIEASIISSPLWKHFRKLELVDNMRARTDPGFTNFLMRIGNGEEQVNSNGQIRIPQPMLIPYTSIEQSIESLISAVYPDISQFERNPFEMMKRAILCPKNEFVDDVNSRLIQRISGKEVVYVSDDRAKNLADQGDYVDYLNTLEPQGLPQHILVLKVNNPVILLRNINPVEGLCNGTRLICKHLSPNLVGAIIATGQFKGKQTWIPRIPFESKITDTKYPIPFIRRQIPLKLCFAMTINKFQGQTLDYVGVYLRQPVFSHGQLYVALSRVKTGKNVKVLITPPTCEDLETEYTTNVVYNEVLVKARSL